MTLKFLRPLSVDDPREIEVGRRRERGGGGGGGVERVGEWEGREGVLYYYMNR